jgi:hypothetical protein
MRDLVTGRFLLGSVPANKRHGMKDTREYRIWAGMLNRCRNPKVKAYPDYGGRGIKVCDRWVLFDNFYADMGDCPPGWTIERRDSNGDYEPDNCEWLDRTRQNWNRRDSRLVTFDGVTKPLNTWRQEFGMSSSSLYNRLRKGMTPEQALLDGKKE